MERLNGEMQAWCSTRPGWNKLSALQLSNVRLGCWANLHDQSIKAAATRGASGFSVELAKQ
eukprot:9473070-Pyramimonas_sp.AAC.1